jgi:cysteine desulfurase
MTDRPIYLDHNATTPVDKRVLDAMLPYFTQEFGNASSVEHRHGNAAAEAVRLPRAQVADAIGARENEIIFTGSATEASNMAILGLAKAEPEKRHAITSVIEHPAVLEPFRELERLGWSITYLDVDESGQVSLDGLRASLRADTALVSVMAGNNEVGTLQPFREIGRIAQDAGALFHTDLAQVMTTQRIDVAKDNVHLASLSAHKAYGPKGIGALYVRSRGPRARIAPLVFGGGQERGLRSGTLNVPLIVGMGEALAIAAREAPKHAERLANLSRIFLERLTRGVAGVRLNGHPTERLPGNVSLSIDGVDPYALMRMISNVVSFSASSACSTNSVETSHVLLAMFGESERAASAFRIAAGRMTTEEEMLFAADTIVEACNRLSRLVA